MDTQDFVNIFDENVGDKTGSRKKRGIFGIILEVVDWVETAYDIYDAFTTDENEYQYEYEYVDEIESETEIPENHTTYMKKLNLTIFCVTHLILKIRQKI